MNNYTVRYTRKNIVFYIIEFEKQGKYSKKTIQVHPEETHTKKNNTSINTRFIRRNTIQ